MFKRVMPLIVLCLALALAGCDQSLSPGDAISPQADLQVTGLSVPGGAVLAPIVSSGQSSQTSGTSLEFPQVGVEVTVFNGVSVNFTGFGIDYVREDGSALGVSPVRGFLSTFLPARFAPEVPGQIAAAEPSVATLRIPAVSADLRSFFAGADRQLGTPDDNGSTVTAVISLAAKDINAHDIRLSARITITAQPQAEVGSD